MTDRAARDRRCADVCDPATAGWLVRPPGRVPINGAGDNREVAALVADTTPITNMIQTPCSKR